MLTKIWNFGYPVELLKVPAKIKIKMVLVKGVSSSSGVTNKMMVCVSIICISDDIIYKD